MPIDPLGPGGPPRIQHEQGLGLPVPSQEAPASPGFGELLARALGEVNALQAHAGQTVQRFAAGDRMDVHQVMIALEQASTAMQLTLQVRNKLVEAYQEVIRMQV